MMQDLSTAVAAAHRAQLLTEACLDRLARVATCCRPGVVHRRATALIEWVRTGQLQAGQVDPRTAPTAERPCCV